MVYGLSTTDSKLVLFSAPGVTVAVLIIVVAGIIIVIRPPAVILVIIGAPAVILIVVGMRRRAIFNPVKVYVFLQF